ncbi:MAG: hypothetical protein HY580_01005 [Nitrospinae bacterium]|nr:hypothetical protein [Nitrospinota bacterium]
MRGFRAGAKIPAWLWALAALVLAPAFPVWALDAEIGVEELDRLLSLHQMRKPGSRAAPLDILQRKVDEGFPEPVVFSISGVEYYGCNKCHDGEALLDSAVKRMREIVQSIPRYAPGAGKIPLRQYIIQTYQDDLLSPWQFAHATFDTIRVSPGAILIDKRVYGWATHRHETLHLAQPFLGHVNELEAYGLNARSDPKFLVLKHPYFADVAKAFFIPDFDDVVKAVFSGKIRENSSVPAEVQLYLYAFDAPVIDRLTKAAAQMAPLLDEAGRLNRERPLELAYWSDRTGIPSFALDLAAVKLMALPPLTSTEEAQAKAFEIFSAQMGKTDNTRLGYVIDRKKESLMTLQYQLGLTDPAERLRLYFHFLKGRFLAGGEYNLDAEDKTEIADYVRDKVAKTVRILSYEGASPIEREEGEKWREKIKKELADYLVR